MYPATFSQYDEEQAILAAFGGKTDGYFLDIGAYSPDTFSNTRALFLRGWKGVMIEPSPGPMLGLLKEYGKEPRIHLLQAAASTSETPLEMWITDDSVSTADAATFEKWKDQVAFFGKMRVLAVTWQQISLWYGGFDFVNIDAEGISVELFKAMIDHEQRPGCCCVEHDGRLVELAAIATTAGYRMTYANGTNAVFTR